MNGQTITLINVHTGDRVQVELIERGEGNGCKTWTVRHNGRIETVSTHQGWYESK